jgi:tetratricopeptide (TPR) repeat protein
VRQAVAASPDYISARLLLGQLLQKGAKTDEAIEQYREALRIDPLEKSAHISLADLCRTKSRPAESIEHLRYAVRLEPANEERRILLAWELATTGDARGANPAEALGWSQFPSKQTILEARRLDAQAAALARLGRYGQAVQEATKAAQFARAARQEDLAKSIDLRLHLYRASLPFVQPTNPAVR